MCAFCVCRDEEEEPRVTIPCHWYVWWCIIILVRSITPWVVGHQQRLPSIRCCPIEYARHTGLIVGVCYCCSGWSPAGWRFSAATPVHLSNTLVAQKHPWRSSTSTTINTSDIISVTVAERKERERALMKFTVILIPLPLLPRLHFIISRCHFFRSPLLSSCSFQRARGAYVRRARNIISSSSFNITPSLSCRRVELHHFVLAITISSCEVAGHHALRVIVVVRASVMPYVICHHHHHHAITRERSTSSRKFAS